MAGLQSGKDRMMIDSVVWAQYINVTDRHTDSHVATANAELTQYASGGKIVENKNIRVTTIADALNI